MTIQEFIKLNFKEKSDLVCAVGNLIDEYDQDDIEVKVFALHGFFVEVIVHTKEEEIMDIIPYTRGFSFFSKRKEILEKSAALLNNFFII